MPLDYYPDGVLTEAGLKLLGRFFGGARGVFSGRNRVDLVNGFSTTTYLAAGGYVLFNPVSGLWLFGLLLVVVAACCGWLMSYRRYHLIADIPTSHIASAAQGYVELVGHCELHPDEPPLGFRSGPPCVWYRYTVSRQTDLQVIDRGQSDDSFLLVDGSGRCVIDPDNAEIRTSSSRSWQDGDYLIQLDYLAPHEKLYVLGELTTIGGAQQTLDKRADVSTLLAEWKRRPELLMERFDSNGDGEISLQEWQQARQEAEKEVEAQHQEWRQNADIHILRAPADGRPFLISNRDPDQLVQRFQWWAWVHLLVFAASTVTALVMSGRNLF